MINIKLIIASVLLCSFTYAAAASYQWNKVKEKNGISVYTIKVENSDILKVKTQTVIAAHINHIQAILDDIDHRPNWIPYLEQSLILNSISATETIEYSLFSAPWPASDRDFVYRKKLLHRDEGKIIFSMISESSELMPENNNLVRADLMESIYTLTSINENSTQVELIFYADPKGWLPDWIINIIQKILPYLILKNLNHEATVLD